MKRLSILVVLALVSTGIFAGLVNMSPVASAAVDLTPAPVLVSGSASVKEKLSVTGGSDGRTYVVWADRTGANSDIMFSYSSNFGTTFAPSSRINPNSTGNQLNPRALVDQNNNLLVAWQDAAVDGGDIILSSSSNGGRTFSHTHVSNLEAGTQSNPAIATSGNNVAVAWEDYRLDHSIRLWDGGNGSLVREISGHNGTVTDVDFSPNGTMLASASEDKMVKLWNVSTGSLIRNVTECGSRAAAVNWSSDGTMLAVGSYDSNVSIFNTTDFNVIARLNNNSGMNVGNFVNAVSFSPDGSRIAVAYNGRFAAGIPLGYPTQDFNLTVWNLTDYSSWTRKESIGNGHTSSVMDIAFSHNGTSMASCGKDGRLKIWNASTSGKEADVNLVYPVLSISWSPDDSHISAGLGNGSIAIVNVTNTADITWLGDRHTGRVNSVDWNGVRDEIGSGASDPVARIWNTTSGQARLNLSGHVNSVYGVDWTTSGSLFATAGGMSTQFEMGENQIFCAVSHDGGMTFSSPVLVSDSNAGHGFRPDIGMDASGNISMVWYDYRNDGMGDVYFANSTDGGLTFNANRGIAAQSGITENIPRIFVQNSGQAHVVWQYNDGASVRYANSSDGFTLVQDMQNNAQLPGIAGNPSGGNLWVSWRHMDPATKLNHTWANVSYNGGASFADSVHLNFSDMFVGEHDVFINSNNETYVVWEIGNKIYFRTTKLIDDRAPSVVYNYPPDGATGLTIFTKFTIRFSEPMDKNTVESSFSWTNGTGTWTIGDCQGNAGVWNAYGDEVYFVPDIPLQYETTYTITIGVNSSDLAGNTIGTAFTYSFTTGIDSDPPRIEHYPSQTSVSYDREYTVTATITDRWGSVAAARLHYQGVNDTNTSNNLAMTETFAGTYQAVIPAQRELGMIYYYIEAEDAFNNVARNPVNYTNHSRLFNVSVIDGVKPEISHTQAVQQDVFTPTDIWAVVTDEIELGNVVLYYRAVDSSTYGNITMQNNTGGSEANFTCTIPAQNDIGSLLYNITAVDSSGNRNHTVGYTIQIVDRNLPHINDINTTYLANETEVLVRANVTDDIKVEEVTLYFKTVGGDRWVPRAMRHAGGDFYEFTIPSQPRSGNVTIYYYVNATDSSGNQASTLTDQDKFVIEVVGTGDDTLLYYILGIILLMLILLLAYLLIRRFSRKKEPVSEVGETPPPDQAGEEDSAGPVGEVEDMTAQKVDEG